jgi:hypothetical protein
VIPNGSRPVKIADVAIARHIGDFVAGTLTGRNADLKFNRTSPASVTWLPWTFVDFFP